MSDHVPCRKEINGGIGEPMTPLPPITIEEIEKTLRASDAACFHYLCRLRDHLISGEYALLSKADREQAIRTAELTAEARMSAMRASYNGDRRGEDAADAREAKYKREASQLLHLDPPTRAETPE